MHDIPMYKILFERKNMHELTIIIVLLFGCTSMKAVKPSHPKYKKVHVETPAQPAIATTTKSSNDIPFEMRNVATLAVLYRDLNHAIYQFDAEELEDNSVWEFYSISGNGNPIHDQITAHIQSIKEKIQIIQKNLSPAEKKFAKKFDRPWKKARTIKSKLWLYVLYNS